MSQLALEVNNLVKRFGKLTALGGVSLNIPEGEIFALLGPNGAGKTTLIGAICGLVKKTSGTLRVFGQDLDLDSVTARSQIGLVPQEINFDPFFTVEEALQIQMGYFGKPKDPAHIDEILTALNLKQKAKSNCRSLSGGMKRRLLIAKALVHQPKLVFLDEPTAGVDVELRHDLWAYVRRLRERGTTFVLTTHYLEEAEELADRIGIINEGKLLLVEDKTALMHRLGERKLLVRFLTPISVEQLPQQIRDAGGVLQESGKLLLFGETSGTLKSQDVLNALYTARLPLSEVETRKSKLEDILLNVLHGK